MKIELSQTMIYLIIIYAIPVLLTIISLVNRNRRGINKLIIPKYEMPDNIHPSLIGLLIDGEFNKRDYIAGILDLVINNLLKIEKIDQNGLERYFFHDLGKNKEITNEFRKKFYNYLFKKIKKFPEEKEGIFPHKHRELSTYGFISRFLRNRNFLRKYFFRGILPKEYSGIIFFRIFVITIIFGIVIPVFLFVANMQEVVWNMSLEMFLFCVFVGVIMSYDLFFDGKSKEGQKLLYDMKCYKEFLKTINLKNNKTIDFEKHLPYAVAFGIFDDWVEFFSMKLSDSDWMYYEKNMGIFQ